MLCRLTIEKLGALSESVLHLLTLVGGCLPVTASGSEHSGARLHQELTHLHVVARGSAVEWCPEGVGSHGQRQVYRKCPCCEASGNSPAITVSGVDIDAKLNQEPDDVGVTGADGVVQRCDALVIGLTGVVHLGTMSQSNMLQTDAAS